MSGLIDAELIQAIPQGTKADAEQIGGLVLVALAAIERLF